jgi:hypothetical protein
MSLQGVQFAATARHIACHYVGRDIGQAAEHSGACARAASWQLHEQLAACDSVDGRKEAVNFESLAESSMHSGSEGG